MSRALAVAAVAMGLVACSAPDDGADAAVPADLSHGPQDLPNPFCGVTPPTKYVEVSCTTAPSGFCLDTIAPPFF